jgi:hypothetical protein
VLRLVTDMTANERRVKMLQGAIDLISGKWEIKVPAEAFDTGPSVDIASAFERQQSIVSD